MSMRNILSVLGDREDDLWSTFNTAVALADREHARLTLAKTCERPACVWCVPYAFAGLYVPPSSDPEAAAKQLLARATELVPDDISVTTLLLGPDTRPELRRLLRTGEFDAIVAVDSFLRHSRRLRGELRRLEVAAVPALPATAAVPPPTPLPGQVTGLPA